MKSILIRARLYVPIADRQSIDSKLRWIFVFLTVDLEAYIATLSRGWRDKRIVISNNLWLEERMSSSWLEFIIRFAFYSSLMQIHPNKNKGENKRS